MREIHGKHTTFVGEKISKQYQNRRELIFVEVLMFGNLGKAL